MKKGQKAGIFAPDKLAENHTLKKRRQRKWRKEKSREDLFIMHLFIYTTTFYVRLQHHIKFAIKFMEL